MYSLMVASHVTLAELLRGTASRGLRSGPMPYLWGAGTARGAGTSR